MKNKLELVVLIDDEQSTNVYNEAIIDQSGWVENIKAFLKAEEALTFLKTKVDGRFPQPEIIFLDINMPGMNGWEFLDEYEKLQANQKAKVLIVMLTTSLSPDDQKEANRRGIGGFVGKPLTVKFVTDLITVRFPNRK